MSRKAAIVLLYLALAGLGLLAIFHPFDAPKMAHIMRYCATDTALFVPCGYSKDEWSI